MHDELVKFILIQSFWTLNALRCKCFEVLEKISNFERFIQVKGFSSYQELIEHDFTDLIFCDRDDFKECFKTDEFYFSGLG